MTFEFPVTHTEDVLRAAWGHFWKRRVSRKVAAGVVIGVAAVAGLHLSGAPAWIVRSLVAAQILAILYFPAVFHLQQRRSLDFFRKLPAQSVTLRLSDDGFETRSPFGASLTPWRKIERVWRFPQVWLVFHARDKFSILPTKDLPSGAAEYLLRKVGTFAAEIR